MPADRKPKVIHWVNAKEPADTVFLFLSFFLLLILVIAAGAGGTAL